jgi:hypothetical protein
LFDSAEAPVRSGGEVQDVEKAAAVVVGGEDGRVECGPVPAARIGNAEYSRVDVLDRGPFVLDYPSRSKVDGDR